MKYYFLAFKRIFDFNGKSTLSEFWYFVLIHLILSIILGFIGSYLKIPDLGRYYRYLIIIPLISLGFRRLDDAGQIKWLFLIPFVNLILAGLPSKETAHNSSL